jgi:hypothetical protein
VVNLSWESTPRIVFPSLHTPRGSAIRLNVTAREVLNVAPPF